ncbi:hypothetical protein VTN02DRAFT_2424 [Thermoascus thermophilus]
MDDRPEISAAPLVSWSLSSPSPAAVVSSVRDDASSAPSSSRPAVPPPSASMDVDGNAGVDDRTRRATSVLSMDDLEAAQALEGLRADYGQSPRPPRSSQQVPSPAPPQPEPLLSLLTSTHPLISSAINGSRAAYTHSKSYSPRFRSGAEFLERNIGSPVANTVGTVGRKTGVEGGIRWVLERRESAEAARSKRRKVDEEEANPPDQRDVEKGLAYPSSLSSTESLPPYDDHRSPSYDEIDRANAVTSQDGRATTRSPSTWQSRLMISTSGLGVAMSEESLRSLQYCLTWLRWANRRLGNAIVALKNVLKEWDSAKQQQQQQQPTADASAAPETGASVSRAQLCRRIQAVKEDVLSTLKQVVDIVSKYAGGALPENARNLVRRHLTSLPQRFQIASTSNPPPTSDAALSAHRILVLAQEGLDMMAQVSGVVNDTLVSAEIWCERLGRKRSPAAGGANGQPPPQEDYDGVKRPMATEPAPDVPMAGTEEKA